MIEISFEAVAFEWRGPAPFLVARLREDAAAQVRAVARELSYGWGCITCTVTVGDTTVKTSLMPKDGGYLVPLKVELQRAENLTVDSVVVGMVRLGSG
ncbi:MAG: DUF1905 domain-containing protein [Fimbriimonadaceae bacterium]